MPRLRRRLVIAVLLAVCGLLAPAAGYAAPGDIGWEGPSFAGAGGDPTGSKPESKLWWNDGSWWASMFEPATADFHIFRLDTATETWADTGEALDDRSNSRADTLWDGTHLYVASHLFSTPAVTGNASRLYRYSYDAASDTYTADPGFPVAINNMQTETLVIAKDSTGRLWATWTQSGSVYVNRTTTDDRTWGTPFVPPVSGTAVAADDISSVVAFGGNRIGLMWSNQSASALYFAVHVDGAADTAWEASRTALQGPNTADDHINVKSLQSDGSGRVFAAVKTSLSGGSSPRIMLLVRDPATGVWASHVFGRVADKHTRPIVLLDEEAGIVHMFATAPSAAFPGGDAAIYEKTSPIDNISFASGFGTPVIMDADVPEMNDATSTKQNVNSTTGLVVLAGNATTRRYWHHRSLLTAPPPVGDTSTFTPVADAYVKSNATGRNFGGATKLRVRSTGPTIRSYLKFDVDGVSGTIVSARLRLSVTDGGPNGGAIYLVSDNSWSETGLTWANAPPIGTPAVAGVGAVAAGTWVDLDVGSAVTGNGIWTLAVAGGSTNAVDYGSREGANSPQLVITVAAGPPVPSASFTASASSGPVPLPVDFTDASSGAPTAWSWDFGDGATATEQNPSHTFTAAGIYTVRLTVTYAPPDTSTATTTVTVTEPPGPTSTFTPVADAYVKSNSVGSNFGAASFVRVRAGSPTIRSYLKFDVSGVTGNVQSARLRLQVVDDSPNGGSVYVVADSSWGELTVNYSNAPPLSGSPIAAIGGTGGAGSWVEVDVTVAVAGNGILTLAISDGSSNGANYASRETPTAPQLVIIT